MINRVIKSHDNNLNKPKIYRLDKFPAVLKLPFIGETSNVFEKRVKNLTKINSNQVNLRIIFVSKLVLKMQLKDLIPVLNKS